MSKKFLAIRFSNGVPEHEAYFYSSKEEAMRNLQKDFFTYNNRPVQVFELLATCQMGLFNVDNNELIPPSEEW